MFRRLFSAGTPIRTHFLNNQKLYGIALGTGSISGLSYYAFRNRRIYNDSEIDEFEKTFEQLRKSLTDPFVATRMLLSRAKTVHMDSFAGVVRTDALTVGSNIPCEDYTGGIFGVAHNSPLLIQGIFDGHNGHYLSEYLSTFLPDFVWDALYEAGVGRELPLSDSDSDALAFRTVDDEVSDISPLQPPPTAEEINKAIKAAFLEADKQIVSDPIARVFSSPSKTNAVKELRLAYSGTCALLSIYTKDTRELRIALTGDSRAVLGRRSNHKDSDSQTRYDVQVLTDDQNTSNSTEAVRITTSHPGEPVIQDGRYLGWAPTRAFGDAAYKWSLDIQTRLRDEYLGDRPPSSVKTPPYLTAEPEITTVKIQPGDFVVLGSDGLWDCLSNEEVIGLTGVWLEENAYRVWGRQLGRELGYAPPRHSDTDTPIKRSSLPVALPKEDQTLMYKYWKAEKEFLNVDANVSAHLVRNALGGWDRDLTEALLRMGPPRARRFRDDISVVVMFFD